MRIYNDRDSFYQWDTNQKIVHNFKVGDEIHFFNLRQQSALTVRAYQLDNVVVADVPNILLQSSYPIYVYWVHLDSNGQHTKEEFTFSVKQRPKPSGYVYTETEVLSYEYLDARIDEIEQNGVSSEQISNAVEAYLEKNPVIPAATVEPADDDIPKVFFSGDSTGMTKDVEKVLRFAYKSRTDEFGGYVKMKWQGSSTLAFPKKNFTIKMFDDEACESKLKKAFKHWGHEKNKYVLKADYIDHTHARNIVTANLWTEMVECRPDFDSLPDGMKNAPGHGAIDGFPIKLYMNGVYQGIYTWTIGKEDWMFGMDEDNANHAVLCAEKNNNGNKSTTDRNILACEFRGNANIDGNDWDIEFPETVTDAIKTSFNNLINCVKDTDDETFKATIGNYLDLTSAFDYYILAYMSANCDGLGKNLIMMTYDGVKWFCSAYDMDNIWGSRGTNTFVNANYACPEDYYDNNSLLWQRIESCFGTELYARYKEVREKVLSFENVIDKFERFCDLIGTELYAEDVEIYSGIPYPTQNNLKQIRNFFTPRAEYVDACFAEIGVVRVPCTGIVLNAETLTFTAEGTQILTAIVTPDGCTDAITWESNNTSVATVKGGAVTAIANGNATITARCGNYSATCSVDVSGIEVVEVEYTDKLAVYKMESPTTFGTTSDVVDTGVALWESDRDWSIAFAFVQNENTTKNTCVFASNLETVPHSGLSFVTKNVDSLGYTSWFFGSNTNGAGTSVGLGIPKNYTEEVRCVITHVTQSEKYTIKYKYGGNVYTETVSQQFGTAHKNRVYIGAADAWDTPVRPWCGTVNSFDIYYDVLSDEEIDTFLS